MILNLTASTPEQEKIKAYLQNNVTAILADKINNGVQIVKDGNTLISKKTLDGFISYATEEARKRAAKGSKGACIDDATVYGWAIRYFEQDNIQGKLFNLDGTEYQPPKTYKPATTPTIPVTPPAPKPKPQLSIFDMVNNNAEQATAITPKPVIVDLPKLEQKKGSPMYQHYSAVKKQYKDCIVFYRLGDFYEMFESDAITVANALDLTLTSKDFGLDKRVPMTGIPFHAADAYIAKLVAAGYKVAICEQLDGKSERTVERVITRKPEGKQLVDVETGEILQDGNEEISVEEMQKFDGDIDEPDEVPTISKILAGVEIPDEPDDQPEPSEQDEPDDDFDLEKERERLKVFDRNALIILADILGNIFTLE